MAAGDVIIMHGGDFRLDNAGGTLTDYTSDMADVSVSVTLMRGSYHVASALSPKQTLNVPYSWTVNVTGLRKEGATGLQGIVSAWLNSMLGGSDELRSVQVSSPDTGTGSHQITGEVALQNPGETIKHTPGSGDAGKFSFVLNGDGNLTYQVVA